MTGPVLVWFRRDLRLADNPALVAACSSGRPVLPVFIAGGDGEGADAMGAASRWWLHHSLLALGADLARMGLPLVLRSGPASKALPELARETGAGLVVWNRLYDPEAAHRDEAIKADLRAAGIAAESFPGAVLREPWTIKTGAGRPYGVFTPFWRAMCALGDPEPPLPAPIRAEPPRLVPDGAALRDWALTPSKPDWAAAWGDLWRPGEAGAKARLDAFLAHDLEDYAQGRDFPARPTTSRLSPHIHFGEISPRFIWHATLDAVRAGRARGGEGAAMAFLRELGWRDFNTGLLFHNTTLPHANHNAQFDAFPWVEDEARFRAWCRGRTGYPIVDAGMRELWSTGYMHNRVRMIVGSFLVKHLLIDWRRGEAWFRDTLLDADLANNVANWQWVAGSGADAAPYFRIFNPVLQGEKFDAQGQYVRRHVPELARLPDPWLHKPWDAPPGVLAAAGIRLGQSYPEPIVDHGQARARALAAYQSLKGAA